MKFSMLVLTLMITSHAHSMTLSFEEHVKLVPLNKTSDLPVEFLRLHRNFFYYEDQRMVAGTFDTFKSKKSSRSFWDKLRMKLQGQKTFRTF